MSHSATSSWGGQPSNTVHTEQGVATHYTGNIELVRPNVVVIDPDLAEAFPNAKAVNDALREVVSRRERDASAK